MTNEELLAKNESTAKELIRLCNYMSNENDLAQSISDILCSEHRTIQQNFWRTIQLIAKDYAKNMEGYTDLRNEASLVFTNKIDKLDVFLPYV